MTYDRVNWENGTKISDAYIEIDGTRHIVNPAVYSGRTPANATSLNILDKAIEDLFNANSNYLTMNRIYRRMYTNGKYISSDSVYYFGNIQGCCYTKDNKVIIGMMASNPGQAKSNKVKLHEENLSTKSTVREKVLELGHCNSLTFDRTNNILYAVSGSKYENDILVNDYTLYKIDYSTLEIISSKTFENRITACSYDNDNNVLYVGYIASSFYKLDDNLNIVETYNIEKPGYVSSAGIQSFEVYKNKIYCLTIKPDTLIVYDIEDRKTDKIYSIPKYANDFFVGEVEDISYIGNNKFIIFSNALTTYYSQENQLNIFEIDLKNNVLDSNAYQVERGYLANNINTVYVDYSNDDPNPDGSIDNPFKEIYEAISLLNGPRYYGNGRIYVANGRYKNIFLYGNNIEILSQNSNAPAVIIEGVMCYNSNVKFEGITFAKWHPILNYPIEAIRTDLLIGNATITNIETYGIYSEKSRITIRGTVLSTPDITDSDEKYGIYLDNGSALFMGQNVEGYKNIYLASPSANLVPSRYVLAYGLSKYYGDIALTKTNYALQNSMFKYIVFRCSVNGFVKTFKFPTTDTTYVVEMAGLGTDNKLNLYKLSISKNENGLTISANNWGHYNSSDVFNTSSKENDTENANFMSVIAVELTDEP